MNIAKLEALIESVDQGSFSKAAEKLGYTQSGLTHMMNSLETELGFQILKRGYYGIKLTEHGEKIMPKIRHLVELENELMSDIRSIQNDNADTIKIGAYSSVALHWLPSIVQLFKKEYPNSNIEITTGSVSELYDGVNSERFDMAFVSQNDKFPGNFTYLKDDALMAILPLNFNVDITKPFPIKSFEGHNFLMPSLGFDIDIMNIFNNAGVTTNTVSTFVDDPAIISMVEHGLGISMLSELVVRGRSGNVLCLPISPYVCRRMGILTSKNFKPNDMMKRFISLSKKFAQAFDMNG